MALRRNGFPRKTSKDSLDRPSSCDFGSHKRARALVGGKVGFRAEGSSHPSPGMGLQLSWPGPLSGPLISHAIPAGVGFPLRCSMDPAQSGGPNVLLTGSNARICGKQSTPQRRTAYEPVPGAAPAASRTCSQRLDDRGRSRGAGRLCSSTRRHNLQQCQRSDLPAVVGRRMIPAPLEQTRRRTLLLGFATLSWSSEEVSLVVTGGMGRRLVPTSTHVGVLAITPGPAPLVCGSAQLQLFGAFNECAPRRHRKAPERIPLRLTGRQSLRSCISQA